MEKNNVELKIYHQGAPKVNVGFIHKETEEIVLIDVDMASKYCEILAETGGEEPGLVICANEYSLNLLEGTDDSTHFSFPEYKGWEVYCAQLNKYTIRVCLTKSS